MRDGQYYLYLTELQNLYRCFDGTMVREGINRPICEQLHKKREEVFAKIKREGRAIPPNYDPPEE